MFRSPVNATREGTKHYSKALSTWLDIDDNTSKEIRTQEKLLRDLIGEKKARVEIFALMGSGKTTLMYFLRQSTDGSCVPELPDNDDILPHVCGDKELFESRYKDLREARNAIPPLLKLLYDETMFRMAASTIQAAYLLLRDDVRIVYEEHTSKGLFIHDGTAASERFNFSEAYHQIEIGGLKVITEEQMKIIHTRFEQSFGKTPETRPHAIINFTASPDIAFKGVQYRDRPVERSVKGRGIEQSYLEMLYPHAIKTPERLQKYGYAGSIITLNRNDIHIPHRPQDYITVLQQVRQGLEGRI